MSNAFFHKPELALRRAMELQGINQSEAALTLLHDVLSSRRHRTWSPVYEQIMIAYLNLCLKLHRAREAKDGLHQYRNLAQSQAPGSLEKVIRYLLEKAEDQCNRAKAAADAAAASESSTPLSVLEDADAEDAEGESGIGPQAILLSSMTTDPAKSQRDSLLLVPSLKFLWEIYRAILDILRSNSKLEHVYHATSVSAFQFCRAYQRRTEFRRLCDLLRMHLGNLQKYGDDSASAKPNSKVRGWEGWTSDSIELHLQTRFAQLESASYLKLYTEGFRTVEDIYNILQISHHRRKNNPDFAPPKAKLMAKYYEQLIELFWVSENYLFHAFAWYKYYVLCKEYNKGMSEEVKAQQASAVLLAALCIPSLPSKSDEANALGDSGMKERMGRMATLLGFATSNPTRSSLLDEINSQGLFKQVPGYLQQLYFLLEQGSDPLVLVGTGKPLLEQIASHQTGTEDAVELKRYVQPLQSVMLLKLLWNLSSAYHTVKIEFLKGLADGLGMSFENVEKSIVLFTQTHKGLAVRIDHRAGCLRFGDIQMESDVMRSQLTVLGQQLETVCSTLVPEDSEAKAKARAEIYQTVRDVRVEEHTRLLERKSRIEERKEEVERKAQEEVRRKQQQAAAEDAARKLEEEKRIQREQVLREEEKKKKIQQEMENTKKEQLLRAMGHNTDAMTTEEVSRMDTDKLQKEHQQKLQKKKENAERKTKEAAKHLDYMVRAVRIEELPLIRKAYDSKVKQDREQYEKENVERVEKAKKQWESDIQDKAHLTSHNVFSHMSAFEEKAMEGRRRRHEALCDEADRVAEIQAEEDKLNRARKRKADEEKRRRDEEERLKREEEERKAEEERRKKEEARRKREEEEAAARKKESDRMANERSRHEDSRGGSRFGSSGGGKYIPPSQRDRGGSRFDDRGGSGRYGQSRGGNSGGSSYPGGGRYEGRSDRGGNDRWRR
uniref:Eukaryotic translation initiation factor 3 subunit A n=1 Tax=Pseudo-nitzschia multistriata TaxID=183589 RepID=A0A448Z9Q6_9STRA